MLALLFASCSQRATTKDDGGAEQLPSAHPSSEPNARVPDLHIDPERVDELRSAVEPLRPDAHAFSTIRRGPGGIVRAFHAYGGGVVLPGISRRVDAVTTARRFVARWAYVLSGTEAPPNLEVQRVRSTPPSGERKIRHTTVHFRQTTAQGPIHRAIASVTVLPNGWVSGYSGLLIPRAPSNHPALSKSDALALAAGGRRVTNRLERGPELGVFVPHLFGLDAGEARLVWRVDTVDPLPADTYVDATTGAIMHREARVSTFDGGPTYELHSLKCDLGEGPVWCGETCESGDGGILCQGSAPTCADVVECNLCQDECYDFSGSLAPDAGTEPGGCAEGGRVLASGAISSDAGVLPGHGNEAKNAIESFNVYLASLGRDGWDDGQLSSEQRRWALAVDIPCVFCDPCKGSTCPYSAWGSPAVFFEGPYYRAQTAPLFSCTDIILHEFTHGIDSVEAQLPSAGSLCADHGESYNLEESYADVIPQLMDRMNGDDDWILGEGCVSKNINKDNMLYSDAQASQYLPTKVAYLLGQTDHPESTYAGVTVAPIGQQTLSQLWLDTFTQQLNSQSDFRDFARKTVMAASLPESLNAEDAVDAVGLWREGTAFSNLASDGPIAFVAQSDRRLAFTYDSSTQRVSLNACEADGSCVEEAFPNTQSATAPVAAVTENDDVYVFVTHLSSGDVQYRVFEEATGQWDALSNVPNVATDAQPSVAHVPATPVGANATIPEQICLTYKQMSADGGTSSPVAGTCLEVGGTWPAPTLVPDASTSQGPATAWVGTRIYVVWRDATDGLYVSSADGFQWHPKTLLADPTGSSTSSVALSPYRDRLHIAALADGELWYRSYCPHDADCTYRPNAWTSWHYIHEGAPNLVGVSTRAARVRRFADPNLQLDGMELVALRSDGSLDTLFKRSE